jgi:hypothetical protein
MFEMVVKLYICGSARSTHMAFKKLKENGKKENKPHLIY